MLMTPIHMACRKSHEEACHMLIDDHQADINMLLNGKSPLFELVSTAGAKEFNILNYLLK